MKKIFSLIMLIMFIVSISTLSYANEDIWTLDEAINTAIENSMQLEIDDMNKKNSKNVWEKSEDDADKINMTSVENKYWRGASKDSAYCTTERKEKELTPLESEYEYESYKELRKTDELKLKSEIVDVYYSLIKADKDIEYNKMYSEFIAEKLEDTRAKYKKGLISKNDYSLFKLEKENADIEYNLSLTAKKKYIAKFYDLIGVGYKPDIKDLEVNLEYEKIEISVDEALKNAIENRMEISESIREEELKEINFEIIDRYYDEDEVEYAIALNDYEKTKLSVETTEDDIKYEIRTSYNELLNKLDTIKINKNEVFKKEILYKIAQLKNKLGMNTDLDLHEANINLAKVQLDLDNSIIDYIVAKYDFEIAQDVGKGI